MRPSSPNAANRFARLRVQAIQEVHHAGEDARPLAVAPIGHAAAGLSGANAGVELPFQFAGGGIEGDYDLRMRVGVKRAAHDERIDFKVAFLAGIVAPRKLKAMNVGAIDLGERRVMVALGTPAVGRPADAALRRAGRAEQAGNEKCPRSS